MTTFTEILETGVDSNLTRDEIIVQLHQAGATLNKATKLYAAYMREMGLSTAAVSHKQQAIEMLAEQYPHGAGWDVGAVRGAVIDLQDEFSIAESTARDYCKAFSRELGVAHPSEDPRAAMFQYLIDNEPHMGYDELKQGFKDYATQVLGRSVSNANEYWKGYDLHLALTEAKEQAIMATIEADA